MLFFDVKHLSAAAAAAKQSDMSHLNDAPFQHLLLLFFICADNNQEKRMTTLFYSCEDAKKMTGYGRG